MARLKRIVCYTINGSGVGHLTRLLAVARWLRRYGALIEGRVPEVLFLSSSEASGILLRAGFASFKIPSKTVVREAGGNVLEYRRLAKHFVWQTLATFSPDLLVVDKPAGLAVHSGSGVRYGAIDAMRLVRHQTEIELVHRLDRDTSGCLLLAKNRPALLTLQKQIQTNEIRKTYIAVVRGYWDRNATRIDLPLLRETMPNGERKVFVDQRGQEA